MVVYTRPESFASIWVIWMCGQRIAWFATSARLCTQMELDAWGLEYHRPKSVCSSAVAWAYCSSIVRWAAFGSLFLQVAANPIFQHTILCLPFSKNRSALNFAFPARFRRIRMRFDTEVLLGYRETGSVELDCLLWTKVGSIFATIRDISEFQSAVTFSTEMQDRSILCTGMRMQLT
jgi:hypothetical protein